MTEWNGPSEWLNTYNQHTYTRYVPHHSPVTKWDSFLYSSGVCLLQPEKNPWITNCADFNDSHASHSVANIFEIRIILYANATWSMVWIKNGIVRYQQWGKVYTTAYSYIRHTHHTRIFRIESETKGKGIEHLSRDEETARQMLFLSVLLFLFLLWDVRWLSFVM